MGYRYFSKLSILISAGRNPVAALNGAWSAAVTSIILMFRGSVDVSFRYFPKHEKLLKTLFLKENCRLALSGSNED